MVLEWHAAIKRYTELTPFLHYGTSHYNRFHDRDIKKKGHPWRYVIITTVETFNARYVSRFDRTFWGPNIFERVIIDEAHRLRTSGQGVGKHFNPQTGKIQKIGARDAPENIANLILSLEPEYKWMLTATPLVNGLSDLRWVIRFLESEDWLELSLPPNAFGDASDIKHGC